MSDENRPTYSYELAGEEIFRIEKDSKGESEVRRQLIATYKDGELWCKRNCAQYKVALLAFLSGRQEEVRVIQREELPPDKVTKDTPKRPKRDKMLGEMTPDIYNWYRKYKPNEFVTRYDVILTESGEMMTYSGPVKYPESDYTRQANGNLEFRGTFLKSGHVDDVLVAKRPMHPISFAPEECLNLDLDNEQDRDDDGGEE